MATHSYKPRQRAKKAVDVVGFKPIPVISDEDVLHASLVVCGRSRGPEDARALLDALGLLDATQRPLIGTLVDFN